MDILLCAILLTHALPAADPEPTREVRFLGWSSDGVLFAYEETVTTDVEGDGLAPKTTTTTYVKKIRPGFSPGNVVPDYKLPVYMERHGFKVERLESERTERGALVRLPGGSELRVEVVVAKQLRYVVSLAAGASRRDLDSGALDDLYDTLDADVFVSPSGTHAVVVVRATAPWRKTALLRVVALVGE